VIDIIANSIPTGYVGKSAEHDEIDVHAVGFSVYPPGTTFGPYVTKSYEMIWIEEGGAHLDSNGRSFRLPSRGVILCAPGELNHYRWDARRTTRHGYVQFGSATTLAGLPVSRRAGDDDIVLNLLRHVRCLDIDRPPAWDRSAQQAFAYAVRAFTSGHSRTRLSADHQFSDPVERSFAYIRRRWYDGQPRRGPSLGELATAASVTPEHLCRVFTAEIGLSPVAAMRILRLHHAAALLLRTNMTVGQVSSQCGFESQFHFSRAFRAYAGLPPREFRRCREFEPDLPLRLRRIAAGL